MNKRVVVNELEKRSVAFADMPFAKDYFCLGYHSIKKLAKLADAEVRIGTNCRYDIEKMVEYLRENPEVV